MRKTPFVVGEYYHIYNRGTDKRPIFLDGEDLRRFLKSMNEFNVINPIGSIYKNSFSQLRSPTPKLVGIVAYCLNPNHYHFLLEPIADKGIEKFMQRLGTGYTNYFNKKYKRSGVLFQGKFKSIHVDSNEYLLHVSAYINLNNNIHGYKEESIFQSSFNEYKNQSTHQFCNKDIILKQFETTQKYIDFAISSAQETASNRQKIDIWEFDS